MPPTPAYDWLDVFYTCTGCEKRDAMWKDAVAQTLNRYYPDALANEGGKPAAI